VGDAARSGAEQPDADLAATPAELGPPAPPPTDGPVPIPAYGKAARLRPQDGAQAPPAARRADLGWVRFALALPVYFVVLWLVVIPGYPLPLLAKAALGFLLAGMAAGMVTGRQGWLAGLLGFVLVLTLALVTVGLTLGVTGLGPAFLVNGATAHGDTAAVGKVQADLLRELVRFAAGAAFLSLLGGALGSALRHWSHSGRLRGV